MKQIVGTTLRDDGDGPRENFVSDVSSSFYADMYRRDGLTGGHVIMLGQGNDKAAIEALHAWPGGMQLGGGISPDNASQYLDAGASHVIATSYIFDGRGNFSLDKLAALVRAVGTRRLVLDLSCKKIGSGWIVAMNRWQTLTDLRITHDALDQLSKSCDEFLIHAVDVEGKCDGIDEELVQYLASWGGAPITYAGGARCLDDLRRVQDISFGKIDVTIGSALDIFGGSGVSYADCVAFNQRERP